GAEPPGIVRLPRRVPAAPAVFEFQREELGKQGLLMRPLELAKKGFELRLAAGAQRFLELATDGVDTNAHVQGDLVESIERWAGHCILGGVTNRKRSRPSSLVS